MIAAAPSRRDFLRVAALAGGGMLIGFRLPGQGTEGGSAPLEPALWLRIDPDGSILVRIPQQEIGQGVRTTLAALVADELDVELERVTVEHAEPSAASGGLGTGGSDSANWNWDRLRTAGAAAREMLITAAAAEWRVEPETCRADRGTVRDLKGRIADYGLLAAAAARLPVPESPRLKSPRERRLVGRAQRRIEGPEIVTGRAVYGLDVRLPGMLRAVLARPPVAGGELVSFAAEAALAVPGVRACFAVPAGVAVVAENTWAALRGRDALRIEWKAAPGSPFSSAAHRERLIEALSRPGVVTRRDGSAREVLERSDRRLEAIYLYPFAPHAAMEPMNTVARVHDGRCEIWSPTQTPNAVQGLAARALGIEPEAVTVHLPLVGGGFGRRLAWDYALEAVEVARRVEAPVQLVWSREEDLAYGHFQAASAERLRAALGADGRLVAWQHHRASTLHNARGRRPSPEKMLDPELLGSSSWGVVDQPYVAAHFEGSYSAIDIPPLIGPWRAVFSPPAVFARECFLDEIAEARGMDPLALRLELLGAGDPSVAERVELAGTAVDRARLRLALESVARRIGWSDALPAGHARGIACDVFHTGTVVAWAVEIARGGREIAGLGFGIVRAAGAVDCGLVIDPGIVAQQMESGAVWSLGNLVGETTFVDGRAVESNFDSFRLPSLAEIPALEVEVLASDADRPRGVGEPPVASFAPAVVNAASRLLGRRIRELPLTRALAG